MAPDLSEFHSLTFTVSYVSGRRGLGPAYLPILICHCSTVIASSESTENINSFFSFSQKPFIPGRNHMWSELLHGAAMPTCRCCFKAASGGRMSASRNVSGWRRWQSCPVSHRVDGRGVWPSYQHSFRHRTQLWDRLRGHFLQVTKMSSLLV